MDKFLKTFGDDYDDLRELIDIYVEVVENPEQYEATHDIDPEEERVSCIRAIIEILDSSIDNEYGKLWQRTINWGD